MSDALSFLTSNTIFGAGLGLVCVAIGLALVRKILHFIVVLWTRKFMITLEVPCRDKSYLWLLQWMTEKAAQNTQHLSVETSYEEKDTGKVETKYDFVPSVGTHLFK